MTNPDDQLAEYLAEHVTRLHRKKSLRHDLRRRIEMNRGDSSVVVSEIREYLAERPYLRIVAIYSALEGEVDLKPLLDQIGRVWLFPKVEGEDLVFYHVKNPTEDLVIGAFGILEPKEGLRKYEIPQVDLFICPGLGFDLRGGRIGRGRGFYDRVLEKARVGAVKLGVCFGYQLVDAVEMEPHDIRMNGVIAG